MAAVEEADTGVDEGEGGAFLEHQAMAGRDGAGGRGWPKCAAIEMANGEHERPRGRLVGSDVREYAARGKSRQAVRGRGILWVKGGLVMAGRRWAVCVVVMGALVGRAWGEARTLQVADDAGLARALREVREVRTGGTGGVGAEGSWTGWRIVLAPGTYRGGVFVQDLSGTVEGFIVIEGADPKNKPVFVGGTEGLHFSACSYLTLRNLAVRGQPGNGINIDDGGFGRESAHHVTLEGVEIREIGPTGNHDALKVSGVDDLVVRGCIIEGWGGQGIDLVGCHKVVIEGCTLRGKAGFSPSAGVQAKGGSSEVAIRGCTFVNAGERAVNIGGSTGRAFFRPVGATYEAKDVTVEGCRFVGSTAPVAFVGVDGAVVRFNTIYQPEKWVVRILQETTAEGFAPCRNGRVERNLIVGKEGVLRAAVNVGPNTDAGSFVFRENWWYCLDRGAASRPVLPVAEEGGVYGVDPGVEVISGLPMEAREERAQAYGAGGWKSK